MEERWGNWYTKVEIENEAGYDLGRHATREDAMRAHDVIVLFLVRFAFAATQPPAAPRKEGSPVWHTVG